MSQDGRYRFAEVGVAGSNPDVRSTNYMRIPRPSPSYGSAGGVQTNGVVVVTAMKPDRSRIGRLSEEASTCR